MLRFRISKLNTLTEFYLMSLNRAMQIILFSKPAVNDQNENFFIAMVLLTVTKSTKTLLVIQGPA